MLRIIPFTFVQVALIQTVWAQTTTTAPGTTAQAADTGMNPLWFLIIVALIAAGVWYFMRRRSETAASTSTTSTPTGTRVYDRDKP